MSVVINDTEYPPLDVNANFTKNQYVHFYKMFTDFGRDYYGIELLVSSTSIPLFVFTVSKQSERVNQIVVDVTVEMQFSEKVGDHVRAYADSNFKVMGRKLMWYIKECCCSRWSVPIWTAKKMEDHHYLKKLVE